mmetsp:Transcript_21677/g.26587  ORF Transcript_21677/g.26587 Transcript_21677/m.26587 type:complete len:375 (-) Transcript_21677:317-1441(-)
MVMLTKFVGISLSLVISDLGGGTGILRPCSAFTPHAPASISKHHGLHLGKTKAQDLAAITSRSRPSFSNNGLSPGLSTRKSSSSYVSMSMSMSIGSLDVSVASLASTLLSTTSVVPLIPSFAINAGLFLLLKTKLEKMLTPEGIFHSLALGTMLWHTLGWRGWTTCVVYLFLGQLVTKVKFQEKEAMGIAEGRGGRRGPENVWGSAATALLCAAASVQIHPSMHSSSSTLFLGGIFNYDLLLLGYVSALATKLADTFASEIGKAYGKTTFLITSFERVEPGTEGAVSAEGTAAAMLGGSLLPIYGLAIGLINNWQSVGIATIAAFLATNAESWIGATMQGKKGFEWMTNEVVNFINTVIGAGIAIGLGRFLLIL